MFRLSQMSLLNGLETFTKALEKSNIRYGIIGGLAVFAYGGERTTFDIDFLIHADDRSAVEVISRQLGLNVINENKEVLQLSGKIQIDIVFANRPLAQDMLTRLQKVGALPYPVVAAEDLIGLKIQAFASDRSREFIDKGDILTLFKNVPKLDFDQIRKYADVFGVWSEIQELKKLI